MNPNNFMDIINTDTTTFITDLIRNVVLPTVTVYVNDNYNINITTKELEETLKLPNSKYFSNFNQNTHFKKNSSNNTNKKCIWEYKRGKLKGDLCGKPTYDDTNYCSACIKRSALSIKKNVDVDDKNDDFSFMDMPKSNLTDNVIEYDLEIYDSEKNLYKDKYNFIYKRESDDKITIVGLLDYISERMHDLTEEDYIKAKSLNLPVLNPLDN